MTQEYDLAQKFFKACASGQSKIATQIIKENTVSFQVLQVGMSVAGNKKRTKMLKVLSELGGSEENIEKLRHYAWENATRHRQNGVLLELLDNPHFLGPPPADFLDMMCQTHLNAPKMVWERVAALGPSTFHPLTAHHVTQLVKAQAKEALEVLFTTHPQWLSEEVFGCIPLSYWSDFATRLTYEHMTRYLENMPPTHQEGLTQSPHLYTHLQSMWDKRTWSETFVQGSDPPPPMRKI